MHKLLAISTAARPTGLPTQRKLLKVSSGLYKGRLAALYADSPGSISLTYSDYPYQAWSTSQVMISDSYDSPFSGCIDQTGNIYIAYTNSNKELNCVKLTFSNGAWNAGSANTILNVDENYNPSIVKDSNGKLWCLFVNRRISSDSKYVGRVKGSLDDGVSWGGGPDEMGSQMAAASDDMCHLIALQNQADLYAIYCVNRSDLMLKVCVLPGPIWEPEFPILSMDYIDSNFDFAVTNDGRVGLVFIPSESGKVYFREFDGHNWSGSIEVETADARAPQIAYFNNVPHIFYARAIGNGYYTLRHAVKSGDIFIPSDFSHALGQFDKVFLFDSTASTPFQDKTIPASNTSPGDIFYSESSGLLDAVNDCLYLGKQSRFFCAAIVLSTPGTGGVVTWEYFNGVEWVSFTPSSGAYNFDSSDILIYFWQDGATIPSDWQVNIVNGQSAFWIRARVTTGFSTNPVGTQILAAAKLNDVSLAR